MAPAPDLRLLDAEEDPHPVQLPDPLRACPVCFGPLERPVFCSQKCAELCVRQLRALWQYVRPGGHS